MDQIDIQNLKHTLNKFGLSLCMDKVSKGVLLDTLDNLTVSSMYEYVVTHPKYNTIIDEVKIYIGYKESIEQMYILGATQSVKNKICFNQSSLLHLQRLHLIFLTRAILILDKHEILDHYNLDYVITI